MDQIHQGESKLPIMVLMLNSLVSMVTKARETDGGFIVDGAKTWISNSPIADVFVVWAKCGSSMVNVH